MMMFLPLPLLSMGGSVDISDANLKSTWVTNVKVRYGYG
jgi:hypothetical protein